MVPVETMVDLTAGACGGGVGDAAMACNSGLLEIMAEARLIDDVGLGAAVAGLVTDPGVEDILWDTASAAIGLALLTSRECLWLDGIVEFFTCVVEVLSTRSSVIREPGSPLFSATAGACVSKSNFDPWSCSNAN
jgi:hypothetical protein